MTEEDPTRIVIHLDTIDTSAVYTANVCANYSNSADVEEELLLRFYFASNEAPYYPLTEIKEKGFIHEGNTEG